MSLAAHPLFRIAERRTFVAHVTIKVPSDSGKFDEYKFNAQFAYKTQDELKALNDLNMEGTLRAVLMGWDLKDDKNQAVPFDEAHRDALLQINSAQHALNTAYFLNISGAAAKN